VLTIALIPCAALLLLVFALALLLANRLVRRLRSLQSRSLELANKTLPSIIQCRHDGESIDLDAEVAISIVVTTRSGRSQQPWAAAQRTAMGVAAAEARTRSGFNRVFLDIANRDSALGGTSYPRGHITHVIGAMNYDEGDSAARDDDPGPLVRPFVVTRGRTGPGLHSLDVLTLVVAVRAETEAVTVDREYGEIVRLCQGRPISLAELAAHLNLLLATVKALVGDLINSGQVIFRSRPPPEDGPDPYLLQMVLDGIRKL
jgi:hypothetical protein